MISGPFGVLAIFAASRIGLFAIGLFAILHLPINAIEQQKSFHLPVQPHPLLEAWARYDACWYVTIAEDGYRGPIGPRSDMRAGFFPLFPTLVAALTPLVRVPLLAGLVVANVFYLTFLILLWQLVRLDWPADVARRTVWIYLLFPSAMFLSGVYSESVLLALATGALLAARRRHWLSAGLLAAFATLARPVGFVVAAALVLELVAARRAADREERPGFATLLVMLAPIVLAAIGDPLFAALTFGDPFAVIGSQAAVRGPMAAPWQPFVYLWRAGPRLHAYDRSLFDAALALAAVVTLPAIFKHIRPSYAVYACLVVLVPLSGSLISFNRMLLPSFPHAILLGRFVTRPWAVTLVLITFGVLEVVAMSAFATWNWVG